jgi:hypothetical protein
VRFGDETWVVNMKINIADIPCGRPWKLHFQKAIPMHLLHGDDFRHNMLLTWLTVGIPFLAPVLCDWGQELREERKGTGGTSVRTFDNNSAGSSPSSPYTSISSPGSFSPVHVPYTSCHPC